MRLYRPCKEEWFATFKTNKETNEGTLKRLLKLLESNRIFFDRIVYKQNGETIILPRWKYNEIKNFPSVIKLVKSDNFSGRFVAIIKNYGKEVEIRMCKARYNGSIGFYIERLEKMFKDLGYLINKSNDPFFFYSPW